MEQISGKIPVLEYHGSQQPDGRGSVLHVYERAEQGGQTNVLQHIRDCVLGKDHFGDLRSTFPADADTLMFVENIVSAGRLEGREIFLSKDEFFYETLRGAWRMTIFLAKPLDQKSNIAAVP